MLKSGLDEGAISSREDGETSLLLPFSAPKKVPEESSSRFMDPPAFQCHLIQLVLQVPDEIATVHHFPQEACAHQDALSRVLMNNRSFDSDSLCRISSFGKCVVHVSGLASTQNTRSMGPENQREI